jgi:hypothetical protein
MNHRRGSVVVVVVWAVAIAAVMVAATQIVSYRQAVVGREALARVEARWAARAGVEQMLAIMEYHAAFPDPDDVMAVVRDMEDNAIGEVASGAWTISHWNDGVEWAGPRDESSKLNINVATRQQLLGVPGMTPDVVDAIIDWRDEDDNVQQLGAEADYYRNRSMGYRPRNAPFKSIAELELVAGAWPKYVRGEDWNLNGRLDPNEDDGPRTFPDDKPDGKLDAGWSAYLTAGSRQSRMSVSGNEKFPLQGADSETLMKTLGVDDVQAKALSAWAGQGTARAETLLVTPLSQLAQQGASGTLIGIDAQSQDALVRVLAEPNIMAVSGQSASFLSGGKIYIPVRQGNGAVSLEERQYGVGLKFHPTVLDGGRVNLKLTTEASELSQTGAVLSGSDGTSTIMPVVSTRQIDTTVQLGDGQSFAVAGLIRNNLTQSVSRFPGLGDLPVLGALFRSTAFQKDQTELVFVVTPRLVQPIAQAVLPTDVHREPSRQNAILDGKAEGAPRPPASPTAPRAPAAGPQPPVLATEPRSQP